jgi:hypothetical protein
MDRRPSPAGPLIALAGAGLLLASLWLPWYELRVPDAIREMFRGFGEGAGTGGGSSSLESGFGQFFQGLASVIPDAVDVNGWVAMEQGDVALAVLASLVTLAGIAAGGILGPSVRADAGLAGRVIGLMGAACLAIAVYHLLTRPGSDFPGAGDFVSLRHGVWVALLGSVLIIAGGLMAAASPRVAVPGDWPAGSSAEPARTGGFAAPATAGLAPAAADGPAQLGAEAPAFAPTPAYGGSPSTSTAPPGFAPPAA